jgi:hypothetical protein
MIVLIAREPRPDAPCWPGRRLLGAVDALAWPTAWIVLLWRIPGAAGLLRPAIAVAALWAFFRVCEAVFVNHRYVFTTWRWARFAALLLLVWLVLKMTMPA